MIAVVSCGARKLTHPAKAGDLYTGPYASAALRWARSVLPKNDIYILSARYGLVPHERIIAPYEMRLDMPGAVTVEDVREQARELGLLAEVPVVVGGQGYARIARAVWPDARFPFTVGAMGYQLRALKHSHGRVPT